MHLNELTPPKHLNQLITPAKRSQIFPPDFPAAHSRADPQIDSASEASGIGGAPISRARVRSGPLEGARARGQGGFEFPTGRERLPLGQEMSGGPSRLT